MVLLCGARRGAAAAAATNRAFAGAAKRAHREQHASARFAANESLHTHTHVASVCVCGVSARCIEHATFASTTCELRTGGGGEGGFAFCPTGG